MSFVSIGVITVRTGTNAVARLFFSLVIEDINCEKLDELIEDVMDYALMRLDKRLLPQCHEPNDSELEAAGLTSEGTYVPPTLSLRHLKIPDLNFLRESSHSSTESKNNNSNDYTEE